jgi:hypothetical protein
LLIGRTGLFVLGGSRLERLKRALEVTQVAGHKRLLRVLGEIGLVGDRPATREGARGFRAALIEKSAEVGLKAPLSKGGEDFKAPPLP